MRFINSIVDAEVKFVSVVELRTRIVAQIRGKGVAFKDVESFLFKEARREGYYQTEEQLTEARKTPLAWVIYTDRFISWVKKNFTDGWKEKDSSDRKKISPKGSKTVEKVIRKPLTSKRADALLEIPENVKVLEESFIKRGVIVVDDANFDEAQAENLIENPKVLQTLLKALRKNGYKVKM